MYYITFIVSNSAPVFEKSFERNSYLSRQIELYRVFSFIIKDYLLPSVSRDCKVLFSSE